MSWSSTLCLQYHNNLQPQKYVEFSQVVLTKAGNKKKLNASCSCDVGNKSSFAKAAKCSLNEHEMFLVVFTPTSPCSGPCTPERGVERFHDN